MSGMVWPLAKAEDVLGTLVVIVIVIISVVTQLISKAREAQKQLGRRKGPAPEGVPPPAAEGQDALGDEIEEFLKRAAQRRQAAGSRPAAPVPKPGVSETPTRRLVQQPAEVEPVSLEGQPPGGYPSVAAHVSEHLRAAKFAPVSQQLGKEVAEVDSKIQRHLQEKFDHRLGRLAGIGGETASAQTAVDLEAPPQGAAGAPEYPLGRYPAGAASLAAVLANPASLRQAVLLSEIIGRPEHRWA